jgi:predicted small lipoprotein YifL
LEKGEIECRAPAVRKRREGDRKVKKILALSLLLVLIISLAGCGVKKKIEEKASEKIAETLIEKAVGDKDTKVDIAGDTIKITDSAGGEVSLGGTEWPEVDGLPEFKGGSIISAAKDGEGNVMVILEEVEEKDYNNYVDSISKDFTENVTQVESEDYLLYEGKNSQGYSVAVQYFRGDKTLSIIGKNDGQ